MSQELSKAVAKWEVKYSANKSVFGDLPTDFLKENIGYIEKCDQPIMVPGDGDGRNGVWLATQGYHVHANDGAPSGVANAKIRSENSKILGSYESVVQDLRYWKPEPNSYGAVINMHVHFDPAERKAFNETVYNAVKPGGIIMMEVFHPDQLSMDTGGPRSFDICVTPTDFEKDFSDLKIHLCERAEKIINPSNRSEGGPGIVTRFIGQKKL